jgi:hypothetical protein
VRDLAFVEIVNSTISKTSASQGGALCARVKGTMDVVNSVLTGGRTTSGPGGCVYGEGSSHTKLLGVVVSGCSTTDGAGAGINVNGEAKLDLIKCTVGNNTARQSANITSNTYIHGGGFSATDSASVTLEGSQISGNYAQYGAGGFYLSDRTTIRFQGNTPTQVYGNRAGTVGGGIRVASPLPEDQLSRFLRVYNNTANSSPDIGVVANSFQVLSSNGDELLASDSREGFLQVTLNVSGTNGMPSADDLVYTIYDENNNGLSTQTVTSRGAGGAPGGDLKELAISLKRPPGGLVLVGTGAYPRHPPPPPPHLPTSPRLPQIHRPTGWQHHPPPDTYPSIPPPIGQLPPRVLSFACNCCSLITQRV